MKTVVIREYAHGFGWDYGDRESQRLGKVADPVHKCILAKHLGVGVTNPELVIPQILELRGIEEITINRFSKAISEFDNCEGDSESLGSIEELADILKLRVRLSNETLH